MIQLVGDAAREQRQREKEDAQNITVGEARALVNAVLNDFVANHLNQHIVPVIEHYVMQMPALVQSQLEAFEAARDARTPLDRIVDVLAEDQSQARDDFEQRKAAMTERIMDALEADAKDMAATVIQDPGGTIRPLYDPHHLMEDEEC